MRQTTNESTLGTAEDFTPEGLCVTGEAFVMGLDPKLRLLGWLALVRVCTPGQAARFGWGGDLTKAKEALDYLLWRRDWIGRVESVELPKGCGPAARKKTDVYYLKEKGFQALNKVSARLARHARPGRPRGTKLSRVPHELLVAEAWLWTTRRREILEFWPETELKSQIVRSKMRLVREGAEAPGTAVGYVPDEATGDFKMRVRERGGEQIGQVWWVEGEVAVGYRVKQIQEKPEGMDWFVCDRRQGHLIEVWKDVRPMYLGDVTAPAGTQSAEAASGTRFRPRVLKAIDLMGGAATAACIHKILGCYRSHVSGVLAALEREAALSSEAASVLPGLEKGRPSKLYVKQGIKIRSGHEVTQRACACQMVIEAHREDYAVRSYDPARGVLTLDNEIESATFVCVIDTTEKAVRDYLERVRVVEAEVAGAAGATVIAVMSNGERIAEMRDAFDGTRIWDLRRRTRQSRSLTGAEGQRRLRGM